MTTTTTERGSVGRQPVRAVVGDPAAAPAEPWVQQIAAVAQLLDEGLRLPAGVTLLVGENGTGKSTIVEAVAIAETMHGYYTFVERSGGSPRDPQFHAPSHGESFLEILRTRFDSPGLYCLDEPEAALSFESSLALVGVLIDLAAIGGQVLCATHSSIVASTPGARILELGPWGMRDTAWSELEIVRHWRSYLDSRSAISATSLRTDQPSKMRP